MFKTDLPSMGAGLNRGVSGLLGRLCFGTAPSAAPADLAREWRKGPSIGTDRSRRFEVLGEYLRYVIDLVSEVEWVFDQG